MKKKMEAVATLAPEAAGKIKEMTDSIIPDTKKLASELIKSFDNPKKQEELKAKMKQNIEKVADTPVLKPVV